MDFRNHFLKISSWIHCLPPSCVTRVKGIVKGERISWPVVYFQLYHTLSQDNIHAANTYLLDPIGSHLPYVYVCSCRYLWHKLTRSLSSAPIYDLTFRVERLIFQFQNSTIPTFSNTAFPLFHTIMNARLEVRRQFTNLSREFIAQLHPNFYPISFNSIQAGFCRGNEN